MIIFFALAKGSSHEHVVRELGVLQITLSISLGLKSLSFELGLFVAVLCGLGNLGLEVLHEHVARVLGIHVLLFPGELLSGELIQQLLEHLNHTTRLELVRSCLLAIMRLLLQDCNGTAKCINGLRGLKLSQLLAEAPVKLQLLLGEFA